MCDYFGSGQRENEPAASLTIDGFRINHKERDSACHKQGISEGTAF